jgi:hypothetical protein
MGLIVEQRPAFRALNIEGDEQALMDERLDLAAGASNGQIDRETVGLFRKYGIQVPERLSQLEYTMRKEFNEHGF